MNISNLVARPAFLPLAISFDSEKLVTIKEELDALSTQDWFWDEYRQTHMCCLYSGGGETSTKQEVFRNRKRPLQWTTIIDRLPSLMPFVVSTIQPLFQNMGRVTIIKTPPGGCLKDHIDCSRSLQSEYHPKYRFVISGDIAGLYFLSQHGRKNIPSIFNSYVIDGSRSHGMVNSSSSTKYTVCIGSPWQGDLSVEGVSCLRDSLEKYKEFIISRPSLGQFENQVQFQN